MTEQDDELKDLFQQKNMENAFSPDKEDWEKMAAYIKNERTGKRRFFVYLSLLVFVGISTSLFFIEQTENKNASLSTTPQVNNPKTEELNVEAQFSAPDQNALKAKQSKIDKQDQIKKETPEVEKTNISDSNTPSNQTASKSDKTDQKTTPTDNQVKETKEDLVKQKTQTQKKETMPLLASGDGFEKQESGNKSNEPLAIIPVQETDSETLNNVDDPKKDLETNDNKEIPVLNEKQENTATNQTLAQKDTVVSEPDLIVIQEPEILLADALAMKTLIVLTEKPDFTVAAVVPVRDSVVPKKLLSHRVFLEAGINYQLGWKTNNQVEANGINPLAGIQYYHDVSRRVGLSLGLMYTSINHLSATSHTSTTTRLKFGEEVDATVVTAQNMHYLLMPLKLNYSLSRNDFVCFGYTIAYLLDVDSKIETYSTRLNYASEPVVSKSRGYSKGFNPHDGQIAVLYRRRVFKEIYLNGEFFYGLRDIKNDDVYKSKGFERAYGFRLSVGINLWKK